MATYAPLGGIPNVVQGQEQLNQNALAEYTRAQQEKQQTALLAQQTQGAQQENQIRAQQLKDQDALTKTIAQYDPSKNSVLDIPKMITANGGSGQSAINAQNGLVAQKQNYLKMTDEQFAQAQKQADLMQGVHDQVSQADPADKQNVYSAGLATLQQNGVDVSKEPPQYPGDDIFAQHLQPIRLHTALLAEAQKDREVSAQEAKARFENAQAAHQEFINKLTANSKPGDFDKQVDAILPPNGASSGGQNMYTKAMVNGALSRGDLPGAQKIMDDAFQSLNTLNRDISVATNPQIQAGKVAVATAEGQARANIEAAQARGSNAALATVPPHLVAPATAAANKAGEDFAQAQSVSDRLQAMMQDARNGNVVSYQLLPQEGALQLTTSQGVHRINMAEIQNYGGGSLWQKMQGHIGKALTGESIPASVLDDMAEMQKVQQKGATEKYNNSLKTINQNYGANFQPVTMENTTSPPAAAKTAQHVPGGAAQGLKEGQTGTGSDGKKYVVKGGVWAPAQ